MIRTKQSWSHVSDEPISEQAIRALHVPEESFKLEKKIYKTGETFTLKLGNDFILYVLAGVCKTTLNGQLMQLTHGEFVFLDKGAYQFKTASADGVQLMTACGRG